MLDAIIITTATTAEDDGGDGDGDNDGDDDDDDDAWLWMARCLAPVTLFSCRTLRVLLQWLDWKSAKLKVSF